MLFRSQLTHVRNHHRFTNDRQAPDGTTQDRSSTYLRGRDGEHEPVVGYAVGEALRSLRDQAGEALGAVRLWPIGAKDAFLVSLSSRDGRRGSRELRQVRVDRAARTMSLALFAVISWQWTLLGYLPAYFAALTLVNVQNYYRHFGANPDVRAADSVSHYGRVYNFLALNDGYHQEHHLAPGAHWSTLPAVRERNQARLDEQPRVVSPVPAMMGFVHRGRPALHRIGRVESR